MAAISQKLIGNRAGPMSPRVGTPGYHLRQESDDSNDSYAGGKKLLTDVLQRYVTSHKASSRELKRYRNRSSTSPEQFQDPDTSPLSESCFGSA